MTKMHIISEIKRTAAENGGVPLGVKRFADATGIKVQHWEGKYWARWGDAVKEAGIAPNQMKQPLDRNQLLERLAKIAIQLDHFPTYAEATLHTQGSDPFPDKRVLIKKFGGKSQLVAALRFHCQNRDEYAHVVRMCDGLAARPSKEAGGMSAGDSQIGYVYLVKHGSRREYKIGRTNNSLRREGEIAVELPEKIQPVHVIRTDDPAGIEAYWHKRFVDKRKNGEWFALSAADVAAFKRRKFM